MFSFWRFFGVTITVLLVPMHVPGAVGRDRPSHRGNLGILRKCDHPDKLIELKARSSGFEPAVIRVRQDEQVCIKLTSVDTTHAFIIDGYGIHIHSFPAMGSEVQFTASRVGSFEFSCDNPSQKSEEPAIGKLIVRKKRSVQKSSKSKP